MHKTDPEQTLAAALRDEHSKAQTLRLVDYIGNSQERFEALVNIVAGDEALLAQRGAWVISHAAEAHPAVVAPHLGQLLALLRRPGLHDAIKRNIMKALEILKIPEALAGQAAEEAFRFLANPEEAVAIRVYSMAVLSKLCQIEPELAGELRLTLREQLELDPPPAFRSRARHVLRALERLEASRDEGPFLRRGSL